MNEWRLLESIREAYQHILGEKLTGIYVHGSIALGCFRWASSDIDFLVLVERGLTQPEKEALIRVLLDLDAQAPAKGFEMSVVLRSACAPFADPTPFELHYSNSHRANYQRDLAGTCRALQGYDPDLAAHMTVINHKGIALCGEAVETVFAPVPRESYWRSIFADIENAAEAIAADPVYFALNLCRVLAFAQEGLVLSKQEGGRWGMERLPEERDWIAQALSAYGGDAPAPGGDGLRAFAQRMLLRIRQKADFLTAGTEKY